MKALDFCWRIAVAAAAVFVGKLVIGSLVFAVFGQLWENPPPPSSVFPPMLVDALAGVLVLYYPIHWSALSGRHLYLAVFLALFGIGVVLTQVEAVLFLSLPPMQVAAAVIQQTLGAVLLTFVAVWLFRRDTKTNAPAAERLTTRTWTKRVAAASLGYMVLYFAAGLTIYPHIEEFYATQGLSVGPWTAVLQVLNGLVRGALYIAFAALLLRSMLAPRWQVTLATAFLFPVAAGAVSLLIPNAIMPESIRHLHMIEIGWSNFAFGLLAGFLFWRPSQPRREHIEPGQ